MQESCGCLSNTWCLCRVACTDCYVISHLRSCLLVLQHLQHPAWTSLLSRLLAGPACTICSNSNYQDHCSNCDISADGCVISCDSCGPSIPPPAFRRSLMLAFSDAGVDAEVSFSAIATLDLRAAGGICKVDYCEGTGVNPQCTARTCDESAPPVCIEPQL